MSGVRVYSLGLEVEENVVIGFVGQVHCIVRSLGISSTISGEKWRRMP